MFIGGDLLSSLDQSDPQLIHIIQVHNLSQPFLLTCLRFFVLQLILDCDLHFHLFSRTGSLNTLIQILLMSFQLRIRKWQDRSINPSSSTNSWEECPTGSSSSAEPSTANTSATPCSLNSNGTGPDFLLSQFAIHSRNSGRRTERLKKQGWGLGGHIEDLLGPPENNLRQTNNILKFDFIWKETNACS